MNNKTHTPEPWQVLSIESRLITVSGSEASNRTVFHIRFPDGKGNWAELTAEDEANARRIVACVNACEKLSNEFLISGGIYEIGKELLDTKKQRDALASLLTLIKIGLESGTVESKPIMNMSNEEAESVEPIALLSLINAALAKLK